MSALPEFMVDTEISPIFVLFNYYKILFIWNLNWIALLSVVILGIVHCRQQMKGIPKISIQTSLSKYLTVLSKLQSLSQIYYSVCGK